MIELLSRRHDTFKSFTGYQGSSGSCHAALWGDPFRDAVRRRHESLLRDPRAVYPVVRWLLCDTRRVYSDWRLGKAVAIKLGEQALCECIREWYDDQPLPPPSTKVNAPAQGIERKKGESSRATPPKSPSNEQPINPSTISGGVA